MDIPFFNKRRAAAVDTVVERQEPSLLPAVRNETINISDAERISELFGVNGSSFSGKSVNSETAMKVSAVYACVDRIAGSISMLPMEVYRRNQADLSRDFDHPVLDLFHGNVFSGFNSADFWRYMVESLLLRGDGYAYIHRNRAGDPEELEPLHPGSVETDRQNGQIRYFVTLESGQRIGVHEDDMLHIKGPGFNGRRSKSVISWAAKEAIGVAMASEEYSGRFFSNGARPDFALLFPKVLSQDGIDLLRDMWDKRHSGLDNSHKPAVLTEGGTIQQLSMTAEDSQLLESRKFQVIEISRAFGVPPHMIGETEKTSSWGTGVEQMSIAFVTYGLHPRITAIEQEIATKLIRDRNYSVELNVEQLLKGDSKALSSYYRQMVGGSQGPGIMTRNEVRRRLRLAPHDDGDEIYNPKGETSVKETDATDVEQSEPAEGFQD